IKATLHTVGWLFLWLYFTYGILSVFDTVIVDTASVPAYFYNDPWVCQVKIIDMKLTEAITTSTLVSSKTFTCHSLTAFIGWI
ncbi:hypothetical protein MGSAQ_003023, partial [marine sediment metagenome]